MCAGWPAILLAALVLCAVAAPAQARIYKYVDRAGDAHYTDSLQQVPLEYRGQVRDISPELAEMDGPRAADGGAGSGSGADDGGDEPGLAVDLDALTGGEGGSPLAGLLQSVGFGAILLLLLAIPVLYVLSALVFKLACRLAGEDPPGLGKACLILLAQALAGGAVNAMVSGIAMLSGVEEGASLSASVAVTFGGSLLSWLLNAAILSAMTSYAYLKSMWIGVLHTVLIVVLIGVPTGALVFVGLLLR